MISRTRSRVKFCLILGLLTLPAEALLLPVARTPKADEAALEWAADLSPQQLRGAGDEIDAYPLVYRKALLTQMSAEDRSDVWRKFLRRFLREHRDLTREQIVFVDESIELLSSDAFDPPLAPDLKEQISKMFNEAIVVLGNQNAEELFVTLGPKKLQRASAVPFMQRLGDKIRGWGVVDAEYPGCNCNIDIDTCDIWPEDDWLQCSEMYTCNFDLSWPMCGPLWSWACTGWCKIISCPTSEMF